MFYKHYFLGFMSDNETTRTENTNNKNSSCLGCSLDTLTCKGKLKEDFLKHIRNVLKYTVLKLAQKLSEVHTIFYIRFYSCSEENVLITTKVSILFATIINC